MSTHEARSLHLRYGLSVALPTLSSCRYLHQPKARFPVGRLHPLPVRESHPLEAPSLAWRAEVGRGQVVEVDHAVEVEQIALALDQCGLDGGAMGMELVEDAIERILCQGIELGAEDVGQCRATDPLRRRMLGSGLDQPVQDHRAGETARAAGDPKFAQDLAQAEAVPELVADMDRTGF